MFDETSAQRSYLQIFYGLILVLQVFGWEIIEVQIRKGAERSKCGNPYILKCFNSNSFVVVSNLYHNAIKSELRYIGHVTQRKHSE